MRWSVRSCAIHLRFLLLHLGDGCSPAWRFRPTFQVELLTQQCKLEIANSALMLSCCSRRMLVPRAATLYQTSNRSSTSRANAAPLDVNVKSESKGKRKRSWGLAGASLTVSHQRRGGQAFGVEAVCLLNGQTIEGAERIHNLLDRFSGSARQTSTITSARPSLWLSKQVVAQIPLAHAQILAGFPVRLQ